MVVIAPIASFALSRLGWTKLAGKYTCDRPFEGVRIGIISATINAVGYSNCLTLRCDDYGFQLKPMLVFSMFHPTLCIPWTAVSGVTESKSFFGSQRVLQIDHPILAKIQISQSTFSKIAPYLKANNEPGRGS